MSVRAVEVTTAIGCVGVAGIPESQPNSSEYEDTLTRGGAMFAYVRYRYPIYAEVDLDEQEVVRVAIDDQHLSQPFEVRDEALHPASGAVEVEALEVAESMPWPNWEHGW